MPDIETLRSLLARVEAAEEPDRELDADIATIIGGYVYEKRGRDKKIWFYPASSTDNYRRDSFSLPKYTASIDAAVALIGRALPGWSWSVMRSGFGDPALARVWHPSTATCEDPGYDAECKSGSPSLALLAALLKALIAKEEGNAV